MPRAPGFTSEPRTRRWILRPRSEASNTRSIRHHPELRATILALPLPLTDPRPDPPTRSCKVEYVGVFKEANWANVMWLYLTGNGTIPNSYLVALADACFSGYATELLPEVSFEVELQFVRVNVWDGSDVTQAISTQPGATGGKLDPALPANVAVCISWPLAVHYRGGHPRTYLPGPVQSSLAGTTRFRNDYCTDVATRAGRFHTALEAIPASASVSSVEHGVISFQAKKQWRTPPVFRRIGNGAHVDARIDSQRRRLGRDVA